MQFYAFKFLAKSMEGPWLMTQVAVMVFFDTNNTSLFGQGQTQ
jgi:hypothetical protein